MKKASDPKTRILETAGELFYKQGYHATGINQVIQEAEVARASLYLHFPSKEALLIAFLEKRHTYWFERLHNYIATAKSPRQQLLAAFDFLQAMNEEEDYRGCAFLNILSEMNSQDQEALSLIRSHKQDLRDFLANLMEGTSPSAKKQVYLLFEAAIVESQLFHDAWPITEAKKAVKEII
ncbi:TetR/AcrR family transcriptional regulator [Chitinophaga pendula]|uniref:TetR/AcrR family transcriptional regulator n=1 Tax=Chitinophaga TaxID=79328 RepID=UPI000BAEA483|nr:MULTISPECIES: TetR/AcrR family transcriptional regulator [Chitinophaga]ASZ14141.1 TetR family transcriptional regulator [Chitinophaga sp. MD30]UCJ08222.1 TetR/AcrR family transcriptional regulator [Chitinophaga pendula]